MVGETAENLELMWLIGEEYTRHPFYQRKQDSLMMTANDGINFPITDA